MASGTSRIILTLAVPSIFGFLTILYYRRKRLSSNPIEKTKATSSTTLNLSDSMKLDKDPSPIAVAAKVADMQLKESEANSDSKCNGIKALSKEICACEGNEISQNQTNGFKKVSYAAAVKENRYINGSASNIKLNSNQNGNGQIQFVEEKRNNQNGLNKQALRTEHASNGKQSSNGVSTSISNQTVSLTEGVVSSASNTTSQTVTPKSKKKSKGRSPEKNNTCFTDLSTNGSEKDNTDSENTLSNGVSKMSLNENISVQNNVHVTQAQEMSSNLCPTSNSTSPAPLKYTFADSRTFADAVQNSQIKNELPSDKGVIEAAKESDLADQSILEENCFSPESEQSSETLSEITETLQVDVNGELAYSDGFIASDSQDDPLSPEATYCDSLDSADSGRGTSELLFGLESRQNSMVFEFELPADHCGYLIGKKGSHVNYIKDKTAATIWIRNFPLCKEKKVVSVGGDENSIKEALKLIRKRFPIAQYPEVSLEPASLNNIQILCPASLRLALPEGVEFQVVLSATVNAAHFFVQLPTHPSYHALPPFTMSMMSLYSHCHSPVVINPSVGNIVAAPVNGGWFRAEIVEVCEDDFCKVKYLDYGGYQQVQTQTLRQINVEFMQMPFQAIECYLANISCLDEIGWTEESKMAFESFAQGQILSAFVAGYAEDGVPCLHLYKVTGATNTFINQALVETGLVKWVAYEQPQYLKTDDGIHE